jgi:hypothetical protein
MRRRSTPNVHFFWLPLKIWMASLLQTDGSGAGSLSLGILPISRISLSPADTNFYLMRGQRYHISPPVGKPFQGIDGPLQPLAAGCQAQPSRLPPMEFDKSLRCPALTVPTREGCLGVDVGRDSWKASLHTME